MSDNISMPAMLVHNSDDTLLRSNTDNVPKHAVHQTLYSADSYFDADFLPAADGTLHRADSPGDTALHQPAPGQINWLHFVGINDLALLKNLLAPYGIHDLVLEDILSHKQRPKVEDYGSYLFMAARVYQYSAGKLKSDQVYLILGENFVLTFQQRPLGLFSEIRARMSDARYDIRRKDAAFLAYRCIDRLIDDYFLTLDQYNNKVEAIDKTLFADTASNSDLLERIRDLIAAQPERDWQSRDFEDQLGLSGATLRRGTHATPWPLATIGLSASETVASNTCSKRCGWG